MSIVNYQTIPVAREFPKTCTPLANVTADDDTWNGSGDTPISLTADCVQFDVYTDQSSYLVFSASTSEPAQNGCVYVAGMHRFRTSGPTYLHYKNYGAGVNVTVGVNCWAEGG